MYLPEYADILPWDTPKASALGLFLVIVFLGEKMWLQPVCNGARMAGTNRRVCLRKAVSLRGCVGIPGSSWEAGVRHSLVPVPGVGHCALPCSPPGAFCAWTFTSEDGAAAHRGTKTCSSHPNGARGDQAELQPLTKDRSRGYLGSKS